MSSPEDITTIVIDGISYTGDYSQEFLNGLMAAFMSEYYSEEECIQHVQTIGKQLDWDCYGDYAFGNAMESGIICENINSTLRLKEYLYESIDGDYNLEPRKYVTEINWSMSEIGGFERMNCFTDIYTFDDLDFMRGYREAIQWLGTIRRYNPILNTETFEL